MSGTIKATPAVAGAMLLGLTAAANADQAGDTEALQSEVQQLRKELNELKGQSDQSWLDQRRAEDVKQLVRDVLDDAETRSSLMQEGVQAGIDDGGTIFLRSADDSFLMELAGHFQVRYIHNTREDEDGGAAIDNEVGGFQIRRSKFQVEGHIGNPNFGYEFSLAGDRDDAIAFFEDYVLNYEFESGLMVQAGRWKQPFARENLTSSSRQLAVERSLVLETFNVDRSEGIAVFWDSDVVKLGLAANNGISGEFTDFDTNGVDYAVTGRADFRLAGEWDQMRDFSAWSGEPFGAFLGVAGHYQMGESGADDEQPNVLLATVDGSIETAGLGLFAAGYASQYSDTVDGDLENFGLELQAAYNINDNIEPFARYELIVLDDEITGLVDDQVNVLGAGFNWYQKKHDAKFTMDVVYVLDNINGDVTGVVGLDPSTGLGLLDDDEEGDGQLAVRAQYQLKF